MKLFLTLSFTVCLAISGHAQFTILGKTLNQNGEPLPGAYIYLANTKLGTVSNGSGVYKINVTKGKHILVIDYIGYQEVIDTVDVFEDMARDYTLEVSPFLSEEFVVEATRANIQTPFTFQNVKKEQIEQGNLGQDLPILLNQTVSAVTTSDAGAGVGYTGLRIRGSDATRINVTVNGVPLNDAESHGVFWVNMPDFASSTESIQIQRGVGTSSNGAAAFGASLNLQTNGYDTASFAEVSNSYGSFNTHKHSLVLNSGTVSKHFNFEGRLSYIGSDGYIDRSASDLRSYYAAGGYYRNKWMLKAITFHGQEVTQQAWYGTPESRVNGSDEDMLAHAANNGYSEDQIENLLRSGRTYNHYTYDNEVDNYAQTHYQLIGGFQVLPNLYLNVTGHYTRGKGYFEQSKLGEDMGDFGLENPVIGSDTITSTDLVVRRWLDNHFYGGVYSAQYTSGKLEANVGGSVNEYIGDHFGEIIWSQYADEIGIRENYYSSDSRKRDISQYAKAQYRFDKLSFYADIQYRYIEYQSAGLDNDQRPININRHYNFLNPKVGINWSLTDQQNFYASVARASREPVRGDFTDAAPGTIPKPEFLTNAELGWNWRNSRIEWNSNIYFMYYDDQLVLTGAVNDVGSPIRSNVDQSYRAGIELNANIDLKYGLYWQPNLTLSQNRIIEFNETVIDYTNGYEELMIQHTNTDIAFSPSLIGGSELGYALSSGLVVALRTKVVGKQYLDNTSNDQRAMDPYWTNDVLVRYQIDSKYWKNLELSVLVNNILDAQYVSNGYTFNYIYGEQVVENFYYPQAGVNWLAGVKWRF